MTAADIAVEVVIRGRVQGVWYRGWTEGEAVRRGLSGWVRNEADGTVRALFIGPRADVEAMLDACHKGPPAARVEAVETSPVSSAPEEDGFHVRR